MGFLDYPGGITSPPVNQKHPHPLADNSVIVGIAAVGPHQKSDQPSFPLPYDYKINYKTSQQVGTRFQKPAVRYLLPSSV